MNDNSMGGMDNQNAMPSNIGDNGFGGDNQEFDAGVEADTETEPKKYIQQLTGKLSQELRKYNQEQDNQDAELSKYVLGMLIPQTSINMTDKDKNEVIKKLQKGDVDSDLGQDDNSDDSMNMANSEPKLESINKKGDVVDELTKAIKQYRNRRKIKVVDNPFVIK